MVKRSHQKIIFIFLPFIVLIQCIIYAFFSASETSHPLMIKSEAVSTDSHVFTPSAQEQKAIPASQSSLAIGDFEFRVVEVVFDQTAMGFVPVDMGASDQVMFVEFELLTGSKEDFKSLEITVSNGSSLKANAFILISNGMTQMLATVTMKGVSSDYRPGEDNVTWAYVAPKGVDKLYLNFPTGDRVDLTPFIRIKQIKG